jgi:hypothetical protein
MRQNGGNRTMDALSAAARLHVPTARQTAGAVCSGGGEGFRGVLSRFGAEKSLFFLSGLQPLMV